MLKCVSMALGAIAFLGLLAVVLVGWATWAERRETTIMSQALGEERRLTVYNTDEGNVEQVIIVLDGEKTRHGLSAAVQARTLSWLAGSRSPIVIAVDGMGTRDTDLRNAISNPATWRPRIAGRAADFDRFLAYELLPLARKLAGTPAEIYLFGHSLGGLYSLDFAIRKPGASSRLGWNRIAKKSSSNTQVPDSQMQRHVLGMHPAWNAIPVPYTRLSCCQARPAQFCYSSTSPA